MESVRRRRTVWIRIAFAWVLAIPVLWFLFRERDREIVRVFDLLEIPVTLPTDSDAGDFSSLPDTQVHDAYDADRDGVYARLSAVFTHGDKTAIRVPGFAIRESPGGPWQWRIRWAPRTPGAWRYRIEFQGRREAARPPLAWRSDATREIRAEADDRIGGPFVAPPASQSKRFL
ncbi:MAG: DUF5060 domain-containing protein, partial [Planctomycetota bacterium]